MKRINYLKPYEFEVILGIKTLNYKKTDGYQILSFRIESLFELNKADVYALSSVDM
ncbi:MAG: hypothetical protein HC892_01850 [Saprospiraceae bacterium]|nr:hypothetical protein [Saprospiraceae bacterium]